MTGRRIAAAILVLGFAVMLAWNAPGQLSYDSVVQLADGRSGAYNSWHPPVMAWLLGLFDAVVPGTLLFLLFQGGLLLLALLLLLRRGWAQAVVALAIVLTPQWLLYQGTIWKDVLFAAAAIAGFAALARAAPRLSWGWLAAAAALLTLAALTRQNGAVVLVAAAASLGWIAHRQDRPGWLYGIGFLLVTLGSGGVIDWALTARGDGGAGAQAQIRLLQGYDLAGAFARDPGLPPLVPGDPALDKVLRRQGAALWSPLHSDPFAADPGVDAALSDAPDGAIAGAWRALILGHPGLYLRTRLAVFGRTVASPDTEVCKLAYAGITGPPELLKRLGLAARLRPRDRALSGYARAFVGTPVLSHAAWGLLALVLLSILLWRRGPADLAMAGLLAGAILFTLTFVIISIACDYRYLLFLDLSAMAAALHVAGGVIARARRPIMAAG